MGILKCQNCKAIMKKVSSKITSEKEQIDLKWCPECGTFVRITEQKAKYSNYLWYKPGYLFDIRE